MKIPIKLNRSYFPGIVTRLLPSAQDPKVLLDGNVSGERFSQAVSTFKFASTFKTTKSVRFPATVEALASLEYRSPPIILDVAASDGITSLHVMQRIAHDKYYITDLNFEVQYDKQDDGWYYYDMENNCILIVKGLFVIYSDYTDGFFPLNKIAAHCFSKSHRTAGALKKIDLIHPDVRTSNGNIVITTYDIFQKWPHEKVDIIIAANILNRCYFSEHQTVQALHNFISALNDGGRLVVVDNRKIETGTIFQITNKTIQPVKDINGGTEIRELILKHASSV